MPHGVFIQVFSLSLLHLQLKGKASNTAVDIESVDESRPFIEMVRVDLLQCLLRLYRWTMRVLIRLSFSFSGGLYENQTSLRFSRYPAIDIVPIFAGPSNRRAGRQARGRRRHRTGARRFGRLDPTHHRSLSRTPHGRLSAVFFLCRIRRSHVRRD
jgi:hypothetical protein